MGASKRRQVISYVARTIIFIFFLLTSIHVALNREGFAWMWILVAVWVGFLILDGLKSLRRFPKMNEDGSLRVQLLRADSCSPKDSNPDSLIFLTSAARGGASLRRRLLPPAEVREPPKSRKAGAYRPPPDLPTPAGETDPRPPALNRCELTRRKTGLPRTASDRAAGIAPRARTCRRR